MVRMKRLGGLLAAVALSVGLVAAPASADIGGTSPTVSKAEYRWLRDKVFYNRAPSKARVEAVFDTTRRTGKVVDRETRVIVRGTHFYTVFEHDWYKVRCNAGLVNVWYGAEGSDDGAGGVIVDPTAPTDRAAAEDGYVGNQCGTNDYGSRPAVP